MRVLFFASNTLYCKSLLPLAIEMKNRGHEVQFFACRKEQIITPEYIYDNYNTLDVINSDALNFVAKLIGCPPVDFQVTTAEGKYDAVICTVNNLPHMKAFRKRRKFRHHFAVGYRSVPALLRIGEPWRTTTDDSDSVLLDRSGFTKEEIFPKLPPDCGKKLFGFPYIRHQESFASSRKVLIFHPGGRRDVVTSILGETRETCLKKQKSFFARAIVPLIELGYRPVIKIHPLRARYHDLEDMDRILRLIVDQNDIPPNYSLIGPEDSFWPIAREGIFSITYGSASLYELWAAGVSNVVVCNFEGKDRSRHFRHFPDIFLDTYDDYLSFIKKPYSANEQFTLDVISEYARLHKENSSPKIVDLIEEECA